MFQPSTKLPGMYVDHEGRQARFTVADNVPLNGFNIGGFAFALHNFSGETASIISESKHRDGKVTSVRLRFLMEVQNASVTALEDRLVQRKLPELMVNLPYDDNDTPDVLYVVDNKLPRVVFDPQQVFTLSMLQRWLTELQTATGKVFEFTLQEGYPALSANLDNGSAEDEAQSLSAVVAELWQPARYTALATMFGELLFSDARLANGSRVIIDLRGCKPNPGLMQAIGMTASVRIQQVSSTSMEVTSRDHNPNRLFDALTDALKRQGIHPIGLIDFEMGPGETRKYRLVLSSRPAPKTVLPVRPTSATPPVPPPGAGSSEPDKGGKPVT